MAQALSLAKGKIMNTAVITETKIQNYVNGKWTESNAREWLDVVNPATGETLAKVPLSDAGDIGAAIESAASAFPYWRRTPPEDRIQPLFKLKHLLERHIDDLARFITKVIVNTLSEGKAKLLCSID